MCIEITVREEFVSLRQFFRVRDVRPGRLLKAVRWASVRPPESSSERALRAGSSTSGASGLVSHFKKSSESLNVSALRAWQHTRCFVN